jgi:hypothetical protein
MGTRTPTVLAPPTASWNAAVGCDGAAEHVRRRRAAIASKAPRLAKLGGARAQHCEDAPVGEIEEGLEPDIRDEEHDRLVAQARSQSGVAADPEVLAK